MRGGAGFDGQDNAKAVQTTRATENGLTGMLLIMSYN